MRLRCAREWQVGGAVESREPRMPFLAVLPLHHMVHNVNLEHQMLLFD